MRTKVIALVLLAAAMGAGAQTKPQNPVNTPTIGHWEWEAKDGFWNWIPPSDCKSSPNGHLWAGGYVYDSHGCAYEKINGRCDTHNDPLPLAECFEKPPFPAPQNPPEFGPTPKDEPSAKPAPLKCGKYQHVRKASEPICNTYCDEDARGFCRFQCFTMQPAKCENDLHTITEAEWQALMARLAVLEKAAAMRTSDAPLTNSTAPLP